MCLDNQQKYFKSYAFAYILLHENIYMYPLGCSILYFITAINWTFVTYLILWYFAFQKAEHIFSNDMKYLKKFGIRELPSNTALGTPSESEHHGQQNPQVSRGLHRRRSKEYETFVLKNRQFLREELHLCEKASQRVLMYSNNFLHKKLKTSLGRYEKCS